MFGKNCRINTPHFILEKKKKRKRKKRKEIYIYIQKSLISAHWSYKNKHTLNGTNLNEGRY